MRVLVLGGTAWLGREIARQHVAAGHDVTCVARGAGPAPEGASLVRVDRDAGSAALDRPELAGTWDEVVDVTRIPDQARTAAASLAPRARHWTLISTVSVYASNVEPGADESAAVLEASDDADDYGAAKVAVERAMLQALGSDSRDDRLLVLRPGLIAGPGDPSDRFGSWVQRAALAGTGPLLVPTDDVAVQIVDVRDVAGAAVRLAAAGVVGVRNVVGATTTLHAIVDEVREAAGHTGPVVLASADDLRRLDVRHWAGPRSLALWVPVEDVGFGSRSNAALLADGVALRTDAELAEDVLVDERERGFDRERRSGITREEELAVIDALATSAG